MLMRVAKKCAEKRCAPVHKCLCCLTHMLPLAAAAAIVVAAVSWDSSALLSVLDSSISVSVDKVFSNLQ